MGNILPCNACCFFFFPLAVNRFIRCWIRCSMFILQGHLSSLQLLCLKMIVLLLGDECKSTFNTTVLPIFYFFPTKLHQFENILTDTSSSSSAVLGRSRPVACSHSDIQNHQLIGQIWNHFGTS